MDSEEHFPSHRYPSRATSANLNTLALLNPISLESVCCYMYKVALSIHCYRPDYLSAAY